MANLHALCTLTGYVIFKDKNSANRMQSRACSYYAEMPPVLQEVKDIKNYAFSLKSVSIGSLSSELLFE